MSMRKMSLEDFTDDDISMYYVGNFLGWKDEEDKLQPCFVEDFYEGDCDYPPIFKIKTLNSDNRVVDKDLNKEDLIPYPPNIGYSGLTWLTYTPTTSYKKGLLLTSFQVEGDRLQRLQKVLKGLSYEEVNPFKGQRYKGKPYKGNTRIEELRKCYSTKA